MSLRKTLAWRESSVFEDLTLVAALKPAVLAGSPAQ